jgi:isocitrate dehydrogenase
MPESPLDFETASRTNVPHRTVAVAHGDGIGPEITDAVLHVLRESGAAIDFAPVTLGLRAYKDGHSSGVPEDAWDSLARHKVLLKGPMTTPQGGGYKSVNVTLRKTLGLYANVRPCVAYHPYVHSPHPGMDVVIVRENEEDTYGGIEHRQTGEVTQCLKLITRPGCERIVRYAFEYARQQGRRKITCMSKDNIMKLTDGLFHRVFDEIAQEYPDIASEHRIIDIGAARLAVRPRDFDVVVTPNLYGDILSDIAAELAGSIGMAGSANIGAELAMFEAVHGSAPDIAGKNIANPSGMLLAAVMMLAHLGQHETAELIHNAWLCTLEEGLHTLDILNEQTSKRQVGTREFAQAIVERLGKTPEHLKAARYAAAKPLAPAANSTRPETRHAVKTCDGVDIFLDWDPEVRDPAALAAKLQQACPAGLRLTMMTNRGTKVWPHGNPDTFCTDHWRCRFRGGEGEVTPDAILELMRSLVAADLPPIKSENLYRFDGVPGYSVAQGE